MGDESGWCSLRYVQHLYRNGGLWLSSAEMEALQDKGVEMDVLLAEVFVLRVEVDHQRALWVGVWEELEVVIGTLTVCWNRGALLVWEVGELTE